MEEKHVVMEELEKMRRMVRQIWIMVIVILACFAIPTILFGCVAIIPIFWEFLPH